MCRISTMALSAAAGVDWACSTTSTPDLLFMSPRAPFHSLRPALRYAEMLLNDRVDGWPDLADAIGDPKRCAAELNRLLVLHVDSLRMVWVGQWQLTVRSASDQQAAKADACCAIALLVQADGWGRVARCRREGCVDTFVDWSNGANRRQCRHHLMILKREQEGEM